MPLPQAAAVADSNVKMRFIRLAQAVLVWRPAGYVTSRKQWARSARTGCTRSARSMGAPDVYRIVLSKNYFENVFEV